MPRAVLPAPNSLKAPRPIPYLTQSSTASVPLFMNKSVTRGTAVKSDKILTSCVEIHVQTSKQDANWRYYLGQCQFPYVLPVW